MSDVRDFGATGDGKADDTDAIQQAVRHGDGVLAFPQGDYRLTKPIVVNLTEQGRFSMHGHGGTAKLIMAGEGPALKLIGTHGGSADPGSFKPPVWQRERMPTVSQIEIEGAHPKADGIHIDGVMQPTLAGVLIRQVRTAVYVTKRARNILISHCHIYNNTGVGVHLDAVNLHQTIITGSHISYCRLGGIRIERSEIRNLQITGNDIEYNNNRSHKVPGADAEPTAEIYIEASEGSVREGTIASNTIQATYSPGGANIRFIGHSPEKNYKVGLWTISGNLIGSQENNIHLTSARGVTISGNVIYSGHARNLLVEHSRNIVVGPNCFDHNPDYEPNELCTGIRFVDSLNCTLTGLVIQDSQAGQHTVPGTVPIVREALVEFVRCRRMNINGIQVLEGTPIGMLLDECSDTLIHGCTILDDRKPPRLTTAIQWKGPGSGNAISHCRVSAKIDAPPHVRQSENLGN